jgi:hypothetical protein
VIVGGFDIATTTGCAILDDVRPLHVEAFRAIGETDGEIYGSFRTWFLEILKRFGVRYVAIEQALVTDIRAPVEGKPGETRNPVTYKTYLRLYGLRAIALEAANTVGIQPLEVHQATWRKSFTGNGRASKEDSLAQARQILPGLKSKDAAEAVGIAWHLNGVLRSGQWVQEEKKCQQLSMI